MPFVVLTLGMAYGWRLGAATVMLYLVEGAAGLPVFAGTPEKGIGLDYMLGVRAATWSASSWRPRSAVTWPSGAGTGAS